MSQIANIHHTDETNIVTPQKEIVCLEDKEYWEKSVEPLNFKDEPNV